MEIVNNENMESCNINVLPNEVIISIFKYMPLEDLLQCENVCKRWKKLARDSTLWRSIVLIYSEKPGQTEVSIKNLETIKTHSECIRQLKLQYIYSYAVIKLVIENCSNLTSIELVMCRVAKEFETDLYQWPGLKKLNLKNSLALTNENLFIKYDYFKKLNYLALSDFGLCSANCETLLHCNYLSHIYIEKIRTLSLEYVKQLIISKQKILVTLHLYGGDSIDDNCLFFLSHCPMLKDLAIVRCENLSDEGLINLICLRKIEHLQIWNNSNFTETNLLKTLGSPALVTLMSLSLSKIRNISPIIVDVISEYYKKLKFLAVYQCPRIINTDYEKQLKSKFRNIDVVLY